MIAIITVLMGILMPVLGKVRKRHRQGYNSLFLDWHVEYVKIDKKQDAREVRRLELRRWKWFYEGK